MFRILTALGILLLAVISPAFAFEMTPLELELDPAGRESAGSFRIVNFDANPIAVEIAIPITPTGSIVIRNA